ncbi:hypothetical protein RDI58_019471 [Solanum bulbocastanum]|uniref:F-box domain-containing protein n=1 Tax=Solanum bulbocastanum TaxID=147425 RepID=A0AAN8Y6J9_SOLBU
MSDETADCSLAGDVIFEILLRLPVKSLLRFRSVSKSWYCYISSRDFIQMHRRQPIHEKPLRVSDSGPRRIPTISFFSLDPKITTVVVDDEIDELGDFDSDSDPDPSVVVVDLPFPCSHDDDVRIVGSCNGLLCVHFNRRSSIILWNPATRKYKLLESPDCASFYSAPFFPCIMLGFVPQTNDYKVIKLPSSSKNPKVWVYALNSDSWEEIEAPILHDLLPKGGSAVILNHCLYWLSYSNDDDIELDDIELDIITCFDLYNQVFTRIELPILNTVSNLTIQKLVILKGCLSMITYSGNGITLNNYEVWVMSEQQGAAEFWTKQFAFSSFSNLARPVGSWRKGELLLGYPNELSLELISYNPYTKRTHSFQRRTSEGRFKVINYVESLESVEGS